MALQTMRVNLSFRCINRLPIFIFADSLSKLNRGSNQSGAHSLEREFARGYFPSCDQGIWHMVLTLELSNDLDIPLYWHNLDLPFATHS